MLNFRIFIEGKANCENCYTRSTSKFYFIYFSSIFQNDKYAYLLIDLIIQQFLWGLFFSNQLKIYPGQHSNPEPLA